MVQTMFGFHIIKLIDKQPAKKYGLMENIPQVEKTPAAICKLELEGEQIRDRAPALVEKLRKEAGVEILDPSLKALEQAILDASSNNPAASKP